SSDSRGGGLSVTVHAIPFQRKTKTRLRTPGAAGVSSAPEGRRHKPMIFHLPALRTPQKTPASLSPAISRLQSRHPSISLGPFPRSLIAWLRIGEGQGIAIDDLTFSASLWSTGLSSPQLTALATGSNFLLSCPTIQGLSYQFQYKTTLDAASWLPLGAPI